MQIEIKKNTAYVNGRRWGKYSETEDLGYFIINILFYLNRTGENEYKLLINGIDETEAFKKELYERYKNIPNKKLRDSFFVMARISNNETRQI